MSDPQRRIVWLLGAALGAAVVVLGLLVTVFGAHLDAPTIALAVAAAALVYALGQLYAMVWVLSRPDRLAQVGQAAGSFSQAELRDEKRRLLRAIKELEFDFGMGKLSQVDHDSVIARYRLRAIEVMRALDGGSSLHPELVRVLAAAQVEAPGPKPEVTPMPVAAPRGPALGTSGPFDQTTRICGVCGGINDADARYCKQCGAAIKKAEPGRGQAACSGEIGSAP